MRECHFVWASNEAEMRELIALGWTPRPLAGRHEQFPGTVMTSASVSPPPCPPLRREEPVP